MEKSVAFHTLGCKVNRYETDAVAQTFMEAGYQVRPFTEVADVYVINTCTVTGEADRKSRQFLRQAKARNPKALVVAMGCHVELSDASSYADILIGNRDKIKVIEFVESVLTGKIRSIPTLDRSRTNGTEFEEMGIVTSREETRAFIKIEDGCNNFCSYCAIPLARGRVRSRSESAIMQEAEGLVKNGFKEIVLTGIHVCSYGADRNLESDALIDLTEKLSAIEGLERIRLGSLEPQSITEKFIQKAVSIKPLCPHFHISLQSGSDTVLKRMNRKYDTSQYEKNVQELRSRIPSATFTTDVITGFPGETPEEHRQTLAFCEKIDFLDMHVFKFSERSGTKAVAMSPKVDHKTASVRSSEILILAQKMKEAHFARSIGSESRVLIEKVEEGTAYGYTENYMPVRILLPKNNRIPKSCKEGDILAVRMIDYDKETLFARQGV